MRKERGLKILYLLLALFFACSFFSYAPEEQENPLVTETENASFRLVVPQGISFQVRCEDSTSTTQIDESLRLAGSSRNLSLLRTVIFFVTLFGIETLSFCNLCARNRSNQSFSQSVILHYIQNQDGKKPALQS